MIFDWRRGSSGKPATSGSLPGNGEWLRVLTHARDAARRAGSAHVDVGDILLALIEFRRSTAVRVLAEAGVDIDDLRSRAQRRTCNSSPPSRRIPADAELPFTARAKNVLTRAIREARELGHSSLGAEHLFLGLLVQSRGILNDAVRDSGVSPGRIRDAVVRAYQAGPPDFQMELDRSSTRSVHERIIEKIQEAIAVGELLPGDRLPAVRHLADQLNVAVGTVARAYSELESSGAVITDGARGTRVARRQKASKPPTERREVLVSLLRPVVVAAFHMGATGAELTNAMTSAMADIFEPPRPT